MVKGCEKRVVVYKSRGSKYFSEVYFIMKEDERQKNGDKKDIIAEANKIINECATRKRKKKTRKREIFLRILFFVSGAILAFPLYLLFSFSECF